ncbi:MAG TPA: hypothetical protein VKT30_18475, partial [Caulobacteraceae bacterium]|nr:hypothetical protein [Caulobacteraceae bacterium]
ERTVLTVMRHEGVWTVEHEGERFGESREKEVAKASALKRARQLMESGRPCRVQVFGEHGFFGLR